MTIAQLIVQVGADVAQLNTAMNSVQKDLNSINTAAYNLGRTIGTAFSVTAIAGFAKEVFDAADSLVKLHDKTGVSLEGLQRLQAVGDDVGNSLEQITKAISMMQERLSSGNSGAIGAVQQLGLNLQTLKELAPEKQFEAIGGAIAKVSDPAKQAQLAWEAFGRSGMEILPTLKSDMDALGNSAVVMSDRSIHALDAAGDALARLWRNFKNFVGEKIGGEIGALMDREEEFRARLGDLSVLVAEMATMAKGIKAPGVSTTIEGTPMAAFGSAADMRAVTRELEDQREAFNKSNEAAARYAKVLEELYVKGVQDSIVDAEKSYQDLTYQVDNYRGEVQQMTEDAREYLHNHRDDIQDIVDNVFPPLTQAAKQFTKAVNEWGDGIVKAIPPLEKMARTLSDKVGTALGYVGTILNNISGDFAEVASIGVRTAESMLAAWKKGDLFGMIVAGAAGAIAAITKLWGKLKELFGGPSADELAGREIVSKFEDNLHKMLNDQQLVEAGGESWKQTVIAVRDAYIQAGLTEAQALEDVKRLWDSSKQGPEAVAAAIKLIQDRMNGLTQATQAASGAIGNLHVPDLPRALDDNAIPMAAGGLGRTTGPTWFYSGGNEDFAFSGEGKSFGGGGGGDIYIDVVVDGQVIQRSVRRADDAYLRTRRKLRAA